MKTSMKHWLTIPLGCSALVLAAASFAQQPSESQIPSTGEKVEKAPDMVKRDWGEFKLAPRIAEKTKKGEPINYVFS